MRKSSKISMKSFYSSLLLFILLLSDCNCWDIAEGELEHDGGHTIWRIKNPRDTSIYDAIADTETCDVEDTSGLADVEDIGLDVEDGGLDVEEMMDYEADGGVDVIDIGDSDQFDVEDVSIDVGDGAGDVIEDIWDGGGDGGDISDIEDVCIPDCNGKECGSDGCGGVCGVCGMSAYCSNFKCICNTGYANCDNDWGNGCEIYLNSVKSCGTSCEDITNCGTNGECVFGVCKCKGMYDNCDGSWSNGCEANLTNDVDNCGGCGRVCNNPPADYCLNSTTLRDYTDMSSCQNSQCVYEYQDINCPNGCANGRCQYCTPSCARKECGPDSCGGSCGFCGNNSNCSNNKCVCKTGYANCNNDFSDGCEINKNTDVNNCGGCGNVCNLPNTAVNGCVYGSCKVVSCVNGYGNCNGIDSDGCEVNLTNNSSNCGSCGNRCGPDAVCNNGACGCMAGYANCDNDWSNGCEVNLNSINSCGTSCSNKVVCSSTNGTNPLCDNGICRLTCNNRYADCNAKLGSSDGCEVNLNSPLTCGTSCSNIVNCGANSVCNSGSCSCISGYYNCNGSLSDGCEKQGDPKHIWSKRFGGFYGDEGFSVFVDSSGNVYITGDFSSYTIDFGGGPLIHEGSYDIFLAKFDSKGNHLWSKSFGGSNGDHGSSVSIDISGNVYITGDFSSYTIDFGGGPVTNAGGYEIFLAKFDSKGNHIWRKRFGGSDDDEGNSVYVDSSGNVYITGYFDSSTIDFGGGALTNAGYRDIFLAKFDSNGYHKWSKRFGGDAGDYGNSVSVDSSGNAYITGWFESSTIDFGGGILTNAGIYNIFLARFDSNGNHLWSKRFGGLSWSWGNSVSVDSSGNVYGTGEFSGDVDFGGCPLSGLGNGDIFLIKYAP